MKAMFLVLTYIFSFGCTVVYPNPSNKKQSSPLGENISTLKIVPTHLYREKGIPENIPKIIIEERMDFQVLGYLYSFQFDLNNDGKNEFFIQDNAGANKVVFYLTNFKGQKLFKGELFCDSIFILNSKTNGYNDFITLATILAVPSEWYYWKFKKKKYAPTRIKNLKDINCPPVFQEDPKNNVVAYWEIGEHGIDLNNIDTEK